MISKEQLQRIALQTGLALYQQEKDYVLQLFLHAYYQKYKHVVFKGGTCLKYLLGIPRFSEDLDFNCQSPAQFKKEVHAVLSLLGEMGIACSFLKEELFPDAYTAEIAFHGPLYTGTTQTQNKFRIDAGYRTGTLQKPEWKVIKSEYPETPPQFLVLAMSLPELLVEKILSLPRKKGRDLYDLWFLLEAGISLDKKLLEKKQRREKIKNRAFPTKEEYLRDMTRLTTQVIPYEQVLEKVKLALP